MTKNQKLNTNCLLNIFVVVSIRKEENWNDNKNKIGWHLEFSIWFLVTGRSNEKNITSTCDVDFFQQIQLVNYLII